MRKFKLVKTYPGSPKLGTILSPKDGYQMQNGCWIYSIGENKEFWEEVKEKEYKILALEYKGDVYDYSIHNNIYYKSAYNCCKISEALNPSSAVSIHSVKRISDGEIFTVDDLCNPIGEYSYNKKKITKIWFTDQGYLRLSSDNYCIPIDRIEHSKLPLFTTEDGVDVIPKENGEFEYWSLKLDSWKISNAPHILNSNKIIPTKTEDLLRCCNELRFSTKEAAEEYIIKNTPCLSINELCTMPGLNMTNFREKLTSVVKSKIWK